MIAFPAACHNRGLLNFVALDFFQAFWLLMLTVCRVFRLGHLCNWARLNSCVAGDVSYIEVIERVSSIYQCIRSLVSYSVTIITRGSGFWNRKDVRWHPRSTRSIWLMPLFMCASQNEHKCLKGMYLKIKVANKLATNTFAIADFIWSVKCYLSHICNH